MNDKKKIISEHMSALAKKRWAKVSKKKRSEMMKKVSHARFK